MADLIGPTQLLLCCLQTYTAIQRQKTKILLATRRVRSRCEQRLRLRRKMLLHLFMRRRSHAAWTHPRSRYWWDSVVPNFSAQQFLQNFRVSRESFHYICNQTKGTLAKKDTNYRLCVPAQKRIAIAIWKLATGAEYKTISHLFGVGLSTVFNCLQEFCDIVIRVLLPVHIVPPDATKLTEMTMFFCNRWRVPQCVGAIDANHIPIIAPEQYPKDYCNRKGWHSVVLQAVVDGRGQFWDVCVGFPGSVRDAKVLRQSHLWDMLSDGRLLGRNKMLISGFDVGYYLIGDSSYPMQRWLIKPFTDTDRLTPEQRRFNCRMSSARSVIETAFERLKGRWRCLLKRNDCKLELCKKMVLTCCVLHNICEGRGDSFMDVVPVRHAHLQPPEQALPDNVNSDGSDIRAALVNYFKNADGLSDVYSEVGLQRLVD